MSNDHWTGLFTSLRNARNTASENIEHIQQQLEKLLETEYGLLKKTSHSEHITSQQKIGVTADKLCGEVLKKVIIASICISDIAGTYKHGSTTCGQTAQFKGSRNCSGAILMCLGFHGEDDLIKQTDAAIRNRNSRWGRRDTSAPFHRSVPSILSVLSIHTTGNEIPSTGFYF